MALHGSGIGAALKTANNLSDVASLNAAVRNLQGGYVLAQSAVAVSHTGDTAEFTMATITIPAPAMGLNGRVAIECHFSGTNANNKTAKIKFGATQIDSVVMTSVAQLFQTRVANRNATGSQSFNSIRFGAATLVQSVGTAAIDTTANVDITLTGTLTNSADTITLESYQVILYPKA